MKKNEFIKLVTAWIDYERNLYQLEKIGFNLTPEHPMWIISDRYGQLISEKFSISENVLREDINHVFINESIKDCEVKAYISTYAQKLFG